MLISDIYVIKYQNEFVSTYYEKVFSSYFNGINLSGVFR